jgi:hypothetical protein
VIAIVSVSGSIAGRADAQTAARPAAIKEVRSQLGASINNAGLQQAFDASWRKPLSASTSVLLSESHVAFGGTIAATPASLRGGAWFEIAPVSFIVVRAGVDPSQYFGTFDSLTSFDSRTDAFDTDARKARHSALSGRTTKFYVTPALQFRAGRFAGQTSLDIERWSSSAPGPLFYEPTRDTLLDVTGDRLTTWSTAILYEHVRSGGGKFSAGPMHSLMRVQGSSDLNQVQRLGVVLIQQSAGRRLGLAQPRATLVVARYLDDSSKRGQWSAMAALGFTLRRR